MEGRRGLRPTGEESSPLSRAQGGLVVVGGRRTHMAYHKGASGRRNVYMMSSDRPKIEVSQKSRMAKDGGEFGRGFSTGGNNVGEVWPLPPPPHTHMTHEQECFCLSQGQCGQRRGRRRNRCHVPRPPFPGSLGREGQGGEGENSDGRTCTRDFDPSADVSYAEAGPDTWASLGILPIVFLKLQKRNSPPRPRRVVTMLPHVPAGQAGNCVELLG